MRANRNIQYALRASRGKGNSLSGVTLTNVYTRHMVLIGKFTNNKQMISVFDNPRRVLLIQKEETIFHDLIRQKPLIISCSVQSLISFLGTRYFFYPILPANYALGGFQHFHFSLIPPHTCIEFILDRNSSFMHIKAKMSTTAYESLQYILVDKDIELEEVRAQLTGKIFQCPEEGADYCVVFVERIINLRFKKGKHTNKFRAWVLNCCNQEYQDDKSFVNYLADPVQGIKREFYCRYVDDLTLFNNDQLKLGKINEPINNTKECSIDLDGADLDLDEEISEMNLGKKRKKIRPDFYSPLRPPKEFVKIKLPDAVEDRKRKLNSFHLAYSNREHGRSGQPYTRLSKYFLQEMSEIFKDSVTDIDIKIILSQALSFYSKANILSSFEEDFDFQLNDDLSAIKGSKVVFINLFLDAFLNSVEKKYLNE